MSNETPSQIFEAYLPSGLKAWINLTHVVSVRSNITTQYDQPGTTFIIVSMINGNEFKLTNDNSEPFRMWARQFIFAFHSFHSHNS